uniref:Uncharacterized protein n=1 Tax=Anguilla anguilla TaxID=7936 RepID=A0A0E9Q6W4_ANGAN
MASPTVQCSVPRGNIAPCWPTNTTSSSNFVFPSGLPSKY